jgi:hypothetical protein
MFMNRSLYADPKLTPQRRRRELFWSIAVSAVVLAVLGASIGAISAYAPVPAPKPAKPPQTVENMCDAAAAQIEQLAPHTPSYVYTAFEGCMKWREGMQRAGLSGDLDIASEQWLRMQCAGKPLQGWCAR